MRIRNRLGVLYARYGRTEQAREQFTAIVRDQDYAPALTNLGNLAFLDGSYRLARSYFERALDVDPESAIALLGIARVAHREEAFDEAERRHAELASLAPEIAERYSYLAPSAAVDTAERATGADAAARRIEWEEEL